ncbi:hypothetical protein GF357_00390 [Candidatus Dojkabacteria bacterium]|nr:hypothetical protein [Candidatus Dojkabacteria bacterium]
MKLKNNRATKVLGFLRNWRMQIFSSCIYIVGAAILLVLAKQNLGRSLFIFFILTAWLINVFRSKTLLFANVLLIIAVFPFNITIQLSEYFLGFELANFQVAGVRIDSLIPVISILDLAFGITVTSFFVEHNPIFQLKKLLKSKWLWVGIMTYYIAHNLYFLDWLVFVNSSRMLLVAVLGYLAAVNWEYFRHTFTAKRVGYVRLLIVMNIFVQLLISISQFVYGRSVGLHWLGESSLVKGFYGTSWMTLGGRVYLRAYGSFPHPNVLGGFLSLTLIYALSASWVRLRQRSKRGFIIHLLTSGLLTLNILLTFSRTAISIAAVIWGLFIIGTVFDIRKIIRVYKAKRLEKRVKKRSTKKVSSIFGLSLIFERFKQLLTAEKVSWTDRVKLAKTAMIIILEYPLFGVGTGKFIQYIGKNVAVTSGGHYLFEPVHNIFLLLLAEHGVIFGGMMVLTILGLLVGTLRKTFDLIYEKPVLVFCQICIAIWFLLISNVDHYLLTLPQGIAMLGVFVLFEAAFLRIRPRI